MIRMHFPDPADSPTQRTPVRIRYAMKRQPDGWTVPELLYAHGTHRLTRDAWQGFQAAGATLSASSDREARILQEVLGAKVPVLPETDDLDDADQPGLPV